MAWLYFKHMEGRQRLEIIHQERLAEMDKGIRLPELPLDPPRVHRPRDPREPLIHGIVWTALGSGAMLALRLWPETSSLWPLPLPMVLLGVGLMLFYALASKRGI